MEVLEPAFTIKYVITGREDGRWIIKAFDRNDKPIGNQVEVSTPSEAWKVFFMLNGLYYADPIEGMVLGRAS